MCEMLSSIYRTGILLASARAGAEEYCILRSPSPQLNTVTENTGFNTAHSRRDAQNSPTSFFFPLDNHEIDTCQLRKAPARPVALTHH